MTVVKALTRHCRSFPARSAPSQSPPKNFFRRRWTRHCQRYASIQSSSPGIARLTSAGLKYMSKEGRTRRGSKVHQKTAGLARSPEWTPRIVPCVVPGAAKRESRTSSGNTFRQRMGRLAAVPPQKITYAATGTAASSRARRTRSSSTSKDNMTRARADEVAMPLSRPSWRTSLRGAGEKKISNMMQPKKV